MPFSQPLGVHHEVERKLAVSRLFRHSRTWLRDIRTLAVDLKTHAQSHKHIIGSGALGGKFDGNAGSVGRTGDDRGSSDDSLGQTDLLQR